MSDPDPAILRAPTCQAPRYRGPNVLLIDTAAQPEQYRPFCSETTRNIDSTGLMAIAAPKQGKASLPRALRALFFLISLPLLVQYILSRWNRDSQISSSASSGQSSTPPTDQNANLTIWEILSNDERVSRFAKIIGELPDIVRGLSAPQAQFTVYAPVNEAFESFYFPPDPPPFFGLFIAGYHMGPGPVPAEHLESVGTVSSFVNGDIFFDYKQRISVQHTGKDITFNHEAKYVTREDYQSRALNGYIHHIDGVLGLPNSTAHVLRTRPQLSKLREAFSLTRLAESVYDTNSHVSQTLFAPTDAAFDHLGHKAIKFLFSPWGKPYLRVLLKCHVVSNHTLFSDMYWPHGGAESVDFRKIAVSNRHEYNLATLLPKLNLTVGSQVTGGRWHLDISPSVQLQVKGKNKPIDVTTSDILTMDGVVHLIDSLILPPSAVEGQEDSWLRRVFAKLWQQDKSIENLVDLLGPYVDEAETVS
ncbi:hypothetical protein CSAL01_02193 [Colletotrichum salicis]|uniref:FAS1 domain-containing protein n=1 Tax=Colletotrichum salicis TaxID=1209931 RepID=A0A135V774_9PEZI|nr:hypothetical protein CSAL01_02193 [Colletotrichum salicis]